MAKKRLFEIAIIYNPSEKEEKEGAKAEILLQPKTILASDNKSAAILAGREIPETYLEKLDRVEVAVRPF